MKRTVTNEAYLTAPALAQRCIRELTNHFDLEQFDLIVEPSAGTGVFFDLLPKERRLGIDLTAERPDLIKCDFLEWNAPSAGRILVMGNPPFGQRGALAIRFIERAASFASVIAFILPRSFSRDTFQRRIPRNFRLVHSFDCHDDFLYEGRNRSVKTVFQIWEKSASNRVVVARLKAHPHFEMRHAHLSRIGADELERLRKRYPFTIPQVGNFTLRNSSQVLRGSHWFIRPATPSVGKLFEKLDFSFLDGMNTAHTSLGRADIVSAYQSALESFPLLRDAVNSEIFADPSGDIPLK